MILGTIFSTFLLLINAKNPQVHSNSFKVNKDDVSLFQTQCEKVCSLFKEMEFNEQVRESIICIYIPSKPHLSEESISKYLKNCNDLDVSGNFYFWSLRKFVIDVNHSPFLNFHGPALARIIDYGELSEISTELKLLQLFHKNI